MKRFPRAPYWITSALLIVMIAGCSSAELDEDSEGDSTPPTAESSETAEVSETAEGAESEQTASESAEGNQEDSDSDTADGLQTVTFGFKEKVLSDESLSLLKLNAGILKDNPTWKIQIEGHCDSRGGVQYNIALGERRARAVKKAMVQLGISQKRMTVVSYGEERPLDPSETEEAHAKNRRANFVITER